tara:strand:- start:357 stop:962 length:606 start_codon:yes stop_codon:yes gene_type:complete
MNDLDVTKAIQPKSDQINADSLVTGPQTIKIRDVKVDPTGEQPIWVYFEGDDGKPWKPCKTSARCLAAIWGANASQWFGMSCTIFNDPTVTWGGAAVGGIRVSHMEGIDKPRVLSMTKTRGKKGSITIQPLVTKDTPKIDVDAVNTVARQAASSGKVAFTTWWQENPNLRDTIQPIMDEIKATVAAADATPESEDDNGPTI